MSSPSPSRESFRPAAIAYKPPAWAGALVCFILPLSTLAFLASGPHGVGAALCWTLPVWLCVAADYLGPADRDDPAPGVPEGWLDARLSVLFVLQWLNIALLLDLASRLRWETPAEFAASAANVIAMRVLVGTTSCCSGIAVAHELIHRRARFLRGMGRILLWTVCYDHFALEHGRGHHRLASTLADPATARFGERFRDFFWRSVRGQWLDAWRMESARLRKPPRRGWGVWPRHRIAQGLLAQLGLLALITACFGKVALLMFLYQAWVAVRMLEAVNYVQHWGLLRTGSRFGAADAWSTDSWFSLHCFIGLSRHADHHAHAGKPCQQLLYHDAGPKLPYGYFVMVLLVRLRNRRYIELAGQSLRKIEPYQKAKRLCAG